MLNIMIKYINTYHVRHSSLLATNILLKYTNHTDFVVYFAVDKHVCKKLHFLGWR